MATVIKPTEAQIKILVELNTTGALPKGARGVSLEKLEGWGFIEWVEADGQDGWVITPEGQKEIGVPVVDREKVAHIQEIEELLKPVGEWQGAPSVADEVQAVQDVMFTHVLDSDGALKSTDGTVFDTYRSDWADWEKELAGFGETLKWKNTKVWDGLTAEEIRKDLDTAGPINREARRKGQKITRKFIKALADL